MPEMSLLKQAIAESNRLSKRGAHEEALDVLDRAIAEAAREGHNTWVQILSRHASALADEAGDLQLVRRYREQCLALDSESPLALSSLADILRRQGEDNLAKTYAAKAYTLSAARDSDLDRAVVESLLRVWPDLRTSRFKEESPS